MEREAPSHEVKTSIVAPSPPEFISGANVALKVEVSCPSGCDLRGGTLKITAKDAVVREAKIATFDGKVNRTNEIVIKAPTKLGESTWKAVFSEQDKEKIRHPESSAPFTFSVKRHPTSMKFLDAPDPVAVGEEFSVKVGVKCSAGCNLAKKGLEVYDALGARVGSGLVGEVQPQDEAAFWLAELRVKAPEAEGRARWTVRLPASDAEPPHEGSFCSFDFGIAGHPDQVVTVEVVDKETKAPIKDAQVLLRPTAYRGFAYSGLTNEGGVARISVGKDEYQLFVSRNEKEFFLPVLDVTSDTTVKAEISVPERRLWDYM